MAFSQSIVHKMYCYLLLPSLSRLGILEKTDTQTPSDLKVRHMHMHTCTHTHIHTHTYTHTHMRVRTHTRIHFKGLHPKYMLNTNLSQCCELICSVS